MEIKKIQDLTFDDKNANKGTERGSGMLIKSLEQLGFGRSIVIDRNGKIIAGNKTVEAASQLGIDDVIVVKTDGHKIIAVQRDDLDLDKEDNPARKLAFADNRIAEIDLDWDESVFVELTENQRKELNDLFHEYEIDDFVFANNFKGSFEKLNDKHEEPDPEDFFPVIKIKVFPETKKIFDALLENCIGESEMEKMKNLLEKLS